MSKQAELIYVYQSQDCGYFWEVTRKDHEVLEASVMLVISCFLTSLSL